MLLAPKKNNERNGEGLGRSKGGFTSKIHCAVDGLGNPVEFILTGGEVYDGVSLMNYLMAKMLILL